MDHKALKSQLRRSAVRQTARTPFCPEDHEIAAFVDGALVGQVRENIERHLAECRACVSRVGLLTRLMREQRPELQSRAAETGSRAWLRAWPQWAAAASILLVIGFLATTTNFTSSTDPVTEFQAMRNIDSQIRPPEILAPLTGFIGQEEELVIRWTEVPGSLYYEVRVVSDVGDLIDAERVDGTEWTISPDLDLEPNREYFVRIDAFLTDAKPISSDFIPFTLRE